MNANDLTQLAQTIEVRAARAIRRADDAAGAIDQPLKRSDAVRAVSEELRSEWLRLHGLRKPKRGEAAVLTKMHDQLQAAVAGAIANVDPADMPALARAAIVATAAPLRRQ